MILLENLCGDAVYEELRDRFAALLEVERDDPPYNWHEHQSEPPSILTLAAVRVEVRLIDCEALPLLVQGTKEDGLHTFEFCARPEKVEFVKGIVVAKYLVEEGEI